MDGAFFDHVVRDKSPARGGWRTELPTGSGVYGAKRGVFLEFPVLERSGPRI
jgi:hypothetical protein